MNCCQNNPSPVVRVKRTLGDKRRTKDMSMEAKLRMGIVQPAFRQRRREAMRKGGR